MRTEKELWEVVLSRPDLFLGGLCSWLVGIHSKGLLSRSEYLELNQVLKLKRTGNLIYWIGSYNEIQPRIDWIKNRIETL